MTSTVHFMDLRANPKENLYAKLGRLMEAAGIARIFSRRDIVAVKLHFGEMGNTAFIRPVFLRRIVEAVKAHGGNPFLTDANTLYAGTRGNAADHLNTAVRNGFSYAVVDAPLIIADGLRGKSETAVAINRKRFTEVFVANEIAQADALISVAHFKGHELAGFGGAIKNIGMGCASRRGKLAQHSTVSPQISEDKCVGCGDCTEHCSQGALTIVDDKAVLDESKCIGCGECILICPNSAIAIQWDQAIPVFLENMVEYTEGVLKHKAQKSLFLNFITSVSPACDCCDHNDTPIVRDIGILAARDPVAIDQASADLVNRENALPGSSLTTHHKAGEDKFKGLYPNVDWPIQLAYAEEIGLGTRQYNLVKI
ncbi:DUF362 domain-containing protein [Desulfococcus multivorans]|uniref:4Fe-4S ferredoxin-type domain-containing protein n=1 Tax=Desulfococcus multivorans DSM 2059 TaxID=1121405 RepID=S7TYR6_DESML|nr:DUF362 domain-containing protein [Desulfococcus multivorans]AOY56855.1 conserved uncharacterized protein [Desulfococcus multivorans]AQU99398.1 4Fe-4S ferredoxin [Desulfococcus multivorans]EPR41870.1 protein of unknown function DUF362 [Desulfococcus multivorans DSM 2059]SJZ93484.1 hypothetical protein SAMN02745446_02147 [Desulfococcus multivorans DSM 2059]